MAAITDFPSGPLVFLNANNVDGLDNAIAQNGTSVPSWKNQGAIAKNFDVVLPGGNANGTRERLAPLLKQNDAEEFVCFDGSYNILSLDGSAASLGMFHKTGVFELGLVVRRRATSAVASNRRLFGANIGTGGTRGLLVTLQNESTVDGQVTVTVWGGAGELVNFITDVQTPFGAAVPIVIRGDGTRISVSNDFYRWAHSSPYASPPNGADGPATNDYCLGGASVNQVYPLLSQIDVAIGWIYDRNWSAAEYAQARAACVAQIGTGI